VRLTVAGLDPQLSQRLSGIANYKPSEEMVRRPW